MAHVGLLFCGGVCCWYVYLEWRSYGRYKSVTSCLPAENIKSLRNQNWEFAIIIYIFFERTIVSRRFIYM